MDSEDDHKRRNSGKAWSSWFQPADRRRLDEARSKDTRDELDQQFERWIEQQELSTREMTQEKELGHSRSQNAHPESQRGEGNPFVLFKHFVDERLAAFEESPLNIVGALRRFSEEHSARIERAVRMEKETWTHWTGREGDDVATMHRLSNLRSRGACFDDPTGCNASDLILQESAKRNAYVPTQKLCNLFYDPSYPPSVLVCMRSWALREGWDGRPFVLPRLISNEPHPWLSVDWFRYNPYSPISLETHPQLGQFGTKWRNAFEDLLEAALDKPMTSQERFGVRWPANNQVSTWRGPGLDWMLSLQCRGILPPQIPSWYSLVINPSDGPCKLEPQFSGSGVGSSFEKMLQGTHALKKQWAEGLGYSGTFFEQEYYQLADAIAIPPLDLPQSTTPRSELDVYQQQASYTGVCPDDVGSAIQEALKQERQEVPEIPEQGCPDDLGRAVQQAARPEHRRENHLDRLPDWLKKGIEAQLREQGKPADYFDFDSGPRDTLREYELNPMVLETENRARRALEREQRLDCGRSCACPDEDGRQVQLAARLGQGQCPDELDRQVQFATQEQRGHCPDGIGRDIGALARELGCNGDELLDELDEIGKDEIGEDEEEHDGFLPGELWSQERQAKERERHDRYAAAFGNRTVGMRTSNAIATRPEHEALARHWDRMERQPSHPAQDTAEEKEKPVSTSMTTLTTRDADGKITTKIVRNVKFADGREENSESAHTYQSGLGEGKSRGEDEGKARKGWFWS